MKRIPPIGLIALAFVIFATVACMCSNFIPREALIISPDVLPDAQVGVPYEATISISQNETPAGSISLSEGMLPPGLELVYVQAEDSAKISGTPTLAGTYTFTISVWCFGTNVSGQTGEKQYTIVVPDLIEDETLGFDPDSLPDAQVGVPYEATISISNNYSPAEDISLSEGTLPPGLELVYAEAEDSAKITGTPTQAGTFPFTINVWCFGTNDAGQTGEKQYAIVVRE